MPKNTILVLGAVVLAAYAGGRMWAGRAVADGPTMMVYQNPACGCCGQWAAHLERAGFDVTVEKTAELNRIKEREGIGPEIAGCHTAMVDGYIVEGHVPIDAIERLLAERPDVVGIAVPGMPVGSLGMEGPNPQPYDVLTFDANGNTEVFASY